MNKNFSLIKILFEDTEVLENSGVNKLAMGFGTVLKMSDDLILAALKSSQGELVKSLNKQAAKDVKALGTQAAVKMGDQIPQSLKNASKQLAFKRMMDLSDTFKKSRVVNGVKLQPGQLTAKEIDDIISATSKESKLSFKDAIIKSDATASKAAGQSGASTGGKSGAGGGKSSKESFLKRILGRFKKTGKPVPVNTGQVTTLTGQLWKIGKKTAVRTVIVTLAALGLLTWVLYDGIQSVIGEDPLPDDFNPSDSDNDFKKCILDVLERHGGPGTSISVGVNPNYQGTTGEKKVYIEIGVEEYAGKQTGGWLKFWDNKEVETKNGEHGTWSCEQDVIKNINEQEDPQMEMDYDVENMIDLLDFPVSGSDLQSAHALLKTYLSNGRGQSFLSLYQRSGLGGGDLRNTLKYIVTTKASSTRLKDEMLSMITKIEGGTTGTDTEGTKSDKDSSGGNGNLSHITIVWDDKSSGGGSGGGTKYRPCDSFPLTVGCISDKIKDIQRCLNPTANLKVDGYFGPNTLKAMQDKSLFADGDKDDTKITEAIYKTIMDRCEKASGGKDVVKPAEREKVEPIKLETKPVELVKLDPSKMIDTHSMEKLLALSKMRIDGERISEIINSKIKFRGGRYVLKMDGELTEDQLKTINRYMSGKGFSLENKRETLKDNKYVWASDDRDSRRVARKEKAIDKIRSNNEQ